VQPQEAPKFRPGIADIREETSMTLNFTSQRPIVWVGDSRRNLRNFPDDAKKLLGHELYLIQSGGMPKDAKPLKGIGSGVVEIALRYASDAFRVVLALQIGERLYVLHAFQKKSKKGIATPKREVDLIKKRYAEAQELAHAYEKTKTN
jgi:phage-related protein